MKTGIHPQYFASAEIRCSCGNVIVTGSTKEKLKTELCSHCHPFYTGQQKLVDTAGRVDKFEAKRKLGAALRAEALKKAQEKKKKPEAYKEKEVPPEVLARAMSKRKPEGKWSAPLGESLAEEVVKEEMKEAKKGKKIMSKKAVTKKPKKMAAKSKVKGQRSKAPGPKGSRGSRSKK